MTFVGEPSVILTPDHVRALASVVPPLERMRDWALAYSTAKHGISLQTLYRKSSTYNGPSLLIIKDFGGKGLLWLLLVVHHAKLVQSPHPPHVHAGLDVRSTCRARPCWPDLICGRAVNGMTGFHSTCKRLC